MELVDSLTSVKICTPWCINAVVYLHSVVVSSVFLDIKPKSITLEFL